MTTGEAPRRAYTYDDLSPREQQIYNAFASFVREAFPSIAEACRAMERVFGPGKVKVPTMSVVSSALNLNRMPRETWVWDLFEKVVNHKDEVRRAANYRARRSQNGLHVARSTTEALPVLTQRIALRPTYVQHALADRLDGLALRLLKLADDVVAIGAEVETIRNALRDNG